MEPIQLDSPDWILIIAAGGVMVSLVVAIGIIILNMHVKNANLLAATTTREIGEITDRLEAKIALLEKNIQERKDAKGL